MQAGRLMGHRPTGDTMFPILKIGWGWGFNFNEVNSFLFLSICDVKDLIFIIIN